MRSIERAAARANDALGRVGLTGENEAKFETIANAMPQMVWSTLADGFHDYFNDRWYEFTGTPQGSTHGEQWSNLFHPDDQERTWAVWRESLRTGAIYEIHYRLRHHSGDYRWVLGRAQPVRNGNGDIVRWMGTCTDIHEQKRAEQLLQDESVRKDEFLAMLAHELRNPLAPIASAAQILKLVSRDPARVAKTAEVIERQVRHMTSLVDDLLDVSRVTRGLVQLDMETLDLKPIVASAIEQVRPLIETRKHTLKVDMPSGPVHVAGDRTRLVQVIANVLNNAAKYTPLGGQLELLVDLADALVSVQVRDNGVGIDAALLPHIFDLFTQGERTPDRVQGGLGLGLALVKNLVALHGGEVRVHSEGLGQGSAFTVLLPLVTQPAAAPVGAMLDAADASAAAAATAATGPLMIMIVDDNVDAGQSLAALLTLDAHEVWVFDAAASALAFPGIDTVDVFILDIGLPGMNGHELARRLRDRPAGAGAILIALTGYGQPSDRLLALEAGFDHHFVKPMDLEQLSAVLASVSTVPS